MFQPTPVQVNAIFGMIAAYIRDRRDQFFPEARAVSSREMAVLEPFFGRARLTRARIYQLEKSEFPNPAFYPTLREMGFHDLPDFSHMAAITFVDAIVFRERVTMPVLFHELVHVVQYDLLGVDRFAELYVRGFLSGGGYEGIPLEKNAYELDSRFSRNPGQVFDVESVVREWNATERF